MTILQNETSQIKRIHKLSLQLANQIAAGEVIERPASVLKELLENSIDAGSRQIEINIERGGIGLIRVKDNGHGICKEDIKLSIAPHATSKILSLNDLEGVLSYGFRGEALASISSVSRLTLSSCTNEQEHGWCLQTEGREGIPSLKPTPKSVGTLIEVRDLFYNTPARRKFLRSEKTENVYLEEVFKRVALSQPNILFKIIKEDRIEKRFPICKNLETHARRIGSLCGLQFIEDAYFVEAEANGLKCWGWLGSRKSLRSQPDLQYFYVNNRIVRDKVVMHAVRQAYQEICYPGRYPAYVLFFECDPSSVDVNVHPTKHEVRFREARTVHAFISYVVQEGLNKGNHQSHLPWDSSHAKQSSYHSEKNDESLLESKSNGFPTSLGMTEGSLGMTETRHTIKNKHDINNNSVANNNHGIKKPETINNRNITNVILGGLLLVENKTEEILLIIDLKKCRQYLLKNLLIHAYQQTGIQKKTFNYSKTDFSRQRN